MNRSEAYQLLTKYTIKPGLIKHALAVEAVMRAYAEKFHENIEEWGMVGLLHDFDYEKFPTAEEHPYKGAEILRDIGFREDLITAIMGHADYTGVKRESLLSKALYAVDELTGLVTATTLVRPDQKLSGVKASSVKKKMKDKRFAASVNRDDIRNGAAEMKIELTEHIQFVIEAMRNISDQLGL